MIKAAGGSSLILTLVAPEKPVPLIVTTVPIGPVVGEKDLITGFTTKLAELAAVPKVLVTAIGPLVAAGGTTTVICVSEFTVKAPGAPLKATLTVPVKLVPVTVMAAPTHVPVGEKELTVGGAVASTVKGTLLKAVPAGVVTLSLPVVAPGGTVAAMSVAESTVKAAGAPLKATAAAPVKAAPEIWTEEPTRPAVGVKEEMIGARAAS